MTARPDQCWLTSGRWHLNCDSFLIYDRVQTGNHIVQTVEVDHPIYWTWKESEADRSLMDVRTGCWEVRTDASWNRSFLTQCRVRTEKIRRSDGWCWSVWHPVVMNMSFGRMEQWTDGRPDGMTHRPDGWQGIWNLLSSSQCRVFWKCSVKWNPCLQHLYT
jgi:hypothetical protein